MKLFMKNFYPLLLLAIPLSLTGLLQSSTYFFETMFLAHLSSDVLAAGALVSWLFGTFIVILIGILSSINILVSHKYGEKDHEGISLVVRDGLWLAIVLSIPSFILFWNLSPIFILLGQNPAVVQLAQAYLHALAWGLLPNVLMFALLQFIVGLGHARVLLVFSIISVSLTVSLSFALIFGKFGFPALGIAGAGWGTSISYWISFFFLATYVVFNKQYSSYLHFLLTLTKPSYVMELFKVGAPMGFMYCVEVGFFFALTLIMGSLSSQLLAANQIALQYTGTLMSLIFSIAQAITVRMGHLLGSGNVASAERACYVGIFLSAFLMLIIGILYWSIPSTLISIDFDIHNANNIELVHLATRLLTVCALFQLFEATRIALFGALRAFKDTRFTLFISIISFWGISLPLGYLLTITLNFDGTGLWWGMVLGAGFSVLLLFWRFKLKIRNSYVQQSA
jgi:MATE family multidrug resistance protein